MSFSNSIWSDYHNSSKDIKKGHNPTSQLDIRPKQYPRLPKIHLPTPISLEAPFSQLLMQRRSSQDFSFKPIDLPTISNLIFWSCGEIPNTDRRFYPSLGQRYPIEVYLINLCDSTDWAQGVYHYNLKDNALDVLWKKSFSNEELSSLFTYPWANRASVIILMSAVFERTIEKYGERGYRHILLEAGHIEQNFTLVSTAMGLGNCPMHSANEEYFENLLDLDVDRESLVASLVIG